MLDAKFVYKNIDIVKQAMKSRGLDFDEQLDKFCKMYERRKKLAGQLDELRAIKKEASKLYHKQLIVEAHMRVVFLDDWEWYSDTDFQELCQ